MIGQTVSHYRIVEKLGSGGMGVVYKAEDTQLGRFVALKFLPPELLQDEAAKKRLLHEARAISALQHHNICTIHEIGETADGRRFLCMDYYEGETLKDRLARGRLSVEEALDITEQVARGLSEAHKRGLLHRDIKPANILVTNQGVVKILDFGLAKLAGQTKVTKTGNTVGTVAYMSPEQARGEDLDRRSDIFSLGVVLYELLAGQAPFQGDHEAAVMYAIIHTQPKPLEGSRPGITQGLQSVMDQMLEKKASDRYANVEDFLRDIMRTRRGNVSTPAPSRRRIVLLIASIAVVIAAAFALYRYWSPTSDDASKKMLVVLPFENLGSPDDEYFADGITEEITSRLASVRELGVISRSSAIQYKKTPKSMKQIGEELGVTHVLEGTIRWNRGGGSKGRVRITPQLIVVSDDTHVWSQSYDRVIDDIFDVQSDIAENVIREIGVALLDPTQGGLDTRPTENLDAYQAYLRGLDYAGASNTGDEEPSRLAAQMFERAVELDPRFALAYASLSITHSWIFFSGFDPTEERIHMAKAAVDRALELNPALPDVRFALGSYYYLCHRDFDRALQEFDLVLKERPHDTSALGKKAYVERRLGRWEAALDQLETVFRLSPREAGVPGNLGVTSTALRKYAEADRYYDRAISLAPDHVDPYQDRAMNYWLWTGDLQKARATLELMPEKTENHWNSYVWIWQEIYERDYQGALKRISSAPSDVLRSSWWYKPTSLYEGLVYQSMNDPERARTSFESARLLLEQAAREHPEDARIHSALGIAYAGLGRREEAVREGTRGVELLPVSHDALYGPTFVLDLVQIHILVGDHDAALGQLDYLLSIPQLAVSAALLRLDPRFDPLRGDSRFQTLLAKYKVGD